MPPCLWYPLLSGQTYPKGATAMRARTVRPGPAAATRARRNRWQVDRLVRSGAPVAGVSDVSCSKSLVQSPHGVAAGHGEGNVHRWQTPPEAVGFGASLARCAGEFTHAQMLEDLTSGPQSLPQLHLSESVMAGLSCFPPSWPDSCRPSPTPPSALPALLDGRPLIHLRGGFHGPALALTRLPQLGHLRLQVDDSHGGADMYFQVDGVERLGDVIVRP